MDAVYDQDISEFVLEVMNLVEETVTCAGDERTDFHRCMDGMHGILCKCRDSLEADTVPVHVVNACQTLVATATALAFQAWRARQAIDELDVKVGGLSAAAAHSCPRLPWRQIDRTGRRGRLRLR